MHQIFKMLLFLDHVSGISHWRGALKLLLSRAWFLRFCNQNRFEFQIVRSFQNLGSDTFIIADYECWKIFRFAMLDMKLWLKDDNILDQFDPSMESIWMNMKNDLCVSRHHLLDISL